ncbi:MAG: SWIM zinc finger family protein [Candidatus Competibacter sp.]|nr:SWIM zinc finger family protein [Candidatus Competibacter sp.]MDG4582977.1 SWIM zinc finger family protein [Candidatus Competibacter sp.]
MPTPPFDTAQLHSRATDRSIERGREYVQEGVVGPLTRRGDELEADVQGSAPRPYRVWIQFEEAQIADAACTCPYDYEGWCKHIVAVLLTYAEQPNAVEIRPPLAETLATLDREQLQALLLKLADRIPRLNDMIETTLPHVALTTPDGSATSAAQRSAPILVNSRALRQSVRNAILTRGDWDDSYDEDGYGAVDDIVELAEQAQAALEAGDGRTALAILEAVTDEFSKHWEMLNEIGEDVSVFLDGTQTLWSEALLDPDLSAEERQHWADRLGDWMEDFDETAADGLELLQIVVRQGWDDPTLTRILRGETVPGGLWGDDPPPHDQRARIARARLRILERTGQHEAYLNLAQAEHRYDEYALKLLRLDRVEDAVRAGLEQPLSDQGMLEFVKGLHERGEIEAAFQVAEHGLRQPEASTPNNPELTELMKYGREFGLYDTHPQAELATWLRDRAAARGQNERALAAGLIAFRIAPSLNAYQRVETLAGAGWPEQRPKLLDFLRDKAHIATETKVDVFLHESLIDDAIAALKNAYVSSRTLARVMDAAIPSRPEWVIAQARQQAEPIMDGAKSAHYEDAAQWLRKAKQAYEALGQKTEWRAYLGALREKHQRKYKLMPLLGML